MLPESGVQGPLVGHVIFPPLDGTLHFYQVLEGIWKPRKLQFTWLTQSLHFNQNRFGVALDEGTVQGDLLLVGKLFAMYDLRRQDKNMPPTFSDIGFHHSGHI